MNIWKILLVFSVTVLCGCPARREVVDLDTVCYAKDISAYADLMQKYEKRLDSRYYGDFREALHAIKWYVEDSAFSKCSDSVKNGAFAALVNAKTVRQIIVLGYTIKMFTYEIEDASNRAVIVFMDKHQSCNDSDFLVGAKLRLRYAESRANLCRDTIVEYLGGQVAVWPENEIKPAVR